MNRRRATAAELALLVCASFLVGLWGLALLFLGWAAL